MSEPSVGPGKRGILILGMPAETQRQDMSVTDEAPDEVDQILNHRLEPPVLFGTPALFAGHQADLANGAQDVEGQPCTVHDHGVGGELAQRQPLQIHIALELGMVLLAQGMPLVQRNHVVLGDAQVGPATLDLDIRNQ